VGSLILHGQASIVTDTLATILEGGGDVLSGLDQARRALWSEPLRDRMELVRRSVREGGELGGALAENAVLPPMASAVVRVGMTSGDLTGSLRRAAELCNEKQEEITGRLLTLMEPAIILALAGIVGWVFYSLISGILTINDIGAM
jgi:general secretion pathway protein F